MQSFHAGLHAGTATIDITPAIDTDPATGQPREIHLSGYVARIGPAVGVHDPLFARALALSDGRQLALLVVCDLLGLARDLSLEIRRKIATAAGTPVEAVMLACTHTHSGPATLALHECGEVATSYLTTLPPRLVSLAEQAVTAMQPVTLDVGNASLPQGAYNRRGDGQEIDTDVGVARLRDPQGEAVALLINYGCHPVVMNADNRLISTDYPGAAIQALETASGGAGFFLTGADGNVDPVRRGSFEDVEWLGQRLAGAVHDALTEIDAQPADRGGGAATVTYACEQLALPLLTVPGAAELDRLQAQYAEALAAFADTEAAVEAKIRRAMLAWADATLARVWEGTVPDTIEAPLQIIRVGDWALVGIPGELFSGMGRQIKDALPDIQTFIVGYANGDVGYIPDRAAYDVGGYEIAEAYRYYGYPAALAPEAGEMIVQASVRLAGRTSGF